MQRVILALIVLIVLSTLGSRYLYPEGETQPRPVPGRGAGPDPRAVGRWPALPAPARLALAGADRACNHSPARRGALF